MSRSVLFLALALLHFPFRLLAAPGDDGPPISITSPDAGTTFAFGTIKNHSLSWNKNTGMLIVRVTFTDTELNNGQPNDDQHEFRLPGITFDEAKGLFFAKSAKGELIPIAHIKKTLFIKSIETMPNAVVRILHPHGDLTVILEAISPNDPAMHAAQPDTNPDGTHKVDIDKILH